VVRRLGYMPPLMSNTHEQTPFAKAASQTVPFAQMVKVVKAAARSVPFVQMVKGVVDPLTTGKLHLSNSETN